MSSRAYVRPLDLRRGRVDLNHGAGGRLGAQLVEELSECAGSEAQRRLDAMVAQHPDLAGQPNGNAAGRPGHADDLAFLE